MPEARDWLIIRVSGCTIICLICFCNLLEILSIPELVLFGRFMINAKTNILSTGVKWKFGSELVLLSKYVSNEGILSDCSKEDDN